MNEFVEQDIMELLLDGTTSQSVAVRDLLTTADGEPRLYWNFAPLDVASPYAVLSCVGGESDSTSSGASGMEDHQYAIACRSQFGIESAARVANAIKQRLKELCGDGTITNSGRRIQGIFYTGPGGDEVEQFEGGQIGIQGRVVRFRMVYEDNETA